MQKQLFNKTQEEILFQNEREIKMLEIANQAESQHLANLYLDLGITPKELSELLNSTDQLELDDFDLDF